MCVCVFLFFGVFLCFFNLLWFPLLKSAFIWIYVWKSRKHEAKKVHLLHHIYILTEHMKNCKCIYSHISYIFRSNCFGSLLNYDSSHVSVTSPNPTVMNFQRDIWTWNSVHTSTRSPKCKKERKNLKKNANGERKSSQHCKGAAFQFHFSGGIKTCFQYGSRCMHALISAHFQKKMRDRIIELFF